MFDSILSRRDLLKRTGQGLGFLGLAGMLTEESLRNQVHAGAISPMAPKVPHFNTKAKHVIHIFCNGGPSHVDTFDPKPELEKWAGKPIPNTLRTERPTGAALPSPYKFRRYGESGIEVSELFHETAQSIDDICVIRSTHADVPNHEPSLMLMNTGDGRLARPAFGSWVTYGLGTENQNLPGFIAMCPNGYPIKESDNWRSAFLPGAYQGTYIDTRHTEIEKLIENITNSKLNLEQQRMQLDLVQGLNQRHMDQRGVDGALEARIHSMELAYRMQMEAAEAFDISNEPKHIQEMYGEGVHARQLLISRRLVERGVRFIQLWHGAGQPWDHHDDLEVGHRSLAQQLDKPLGALIRDLKQRGMLDETLILWGGEFGRTPTVELPTPGSNAGKLNGRDHNHYGFTTFLAGGGVKGGHVHGATDEFGFAAVEDKVHIHDLQATMLRLLGFDHERLTYRFAGRDFRLTDVHGKIVESIIA